MTSEIIIFPLRARIARSTRMAAEFLLARGIDRLPIDAASLAAHENMRLITYSAFAEKCGLTPQEIGEMYSSDDAFSFISRTNAARVIVYNDLVRPMERISWSIVHEIAHHVLGHFDDFGAATLTDAQSKTLDTEADVWAANVMAPMCVIDLLKKPLREEYRMIFGLSHKGWAVRQRSARQDRRHIDPEFASALTEMFAPFMYAQKCLVCGAVFRGNDGAACPECGGQRSLWLHWDDLRPAKRHCDPDIPIETRITLSLRPDQRPYAYKLLENPMVVDEYWKEG